MSYSIMLDAGHGVKIHITDSILCRYTQQISRRIDRWICPLLRWTLHQLFYNQLFFQDITAVMNINLLLDQLGSFLICKIQCQLFHSVRQ